MTTGILTVIYLASAVLFIRSLAGLGHPETAKGGNFQGAVGMLIAVLATAMLVREPAHIALLVGVLVVGGGVGYTLAKRVQMTSMPELVAVLHSFVGLAAVFVGLATFFQAPAEVNMPFDSGAGGHDIVHLIELFVGVVIGAVTFSGSVVAFGKLRGSITGRPVLLPGRHVLNALTVLALVVLGVWFCRATDAAIWAILIATALSLWLGVHMVIAIGGADMPVVVSMLNSYSGWTAAATGFLLGNDLLIVTGALVGSSGAILSYIMCRAMNRSFISVILGGFGTEAGSAPAVAAGAGGEVRSVDVAGAVELLVAAKSVIVVPGYGMAVAQAQHKIRELSEALREKGTEVRFAIHPVAGRLPGHMNVLLAEAHIPYDQVLEMDEINMDFPKTDVVLVVGANDIVNPGALEDKSSPIYGMPVLEVWKSGTVIILKRSMAAGYSGVDNPLAYRENTRLLFGDARKSIEALLETFRKTVQS
jgi:NAD(P) transhydrogenase subunit beta